MQVLRAVDPSPEQLKIIRDYKPGVTVIRGAGGSGKTTTALMRLSFLTEFFRTRRAREVLEDPVRVLVLTYNKTLRGYIRELATHQVRNHSDVTIDIQTFDKWSYDAAVHESVKQPRCDRKIESLGRSIKLDPLFMLQEVRYLTGRFLPANLGDYVGCRREQRGLSPRVEAPTRRALLDEVLWQTSPATASTSPPATASTPAPPQARTNSPTANNRPAEPTRRLEKIKQHLKGGAP